MSAKEDKKKNTSAQWNLYQLALWEIKFYHAIHIFSFFLEANVNRCLYCCFFICFLFSDLSPRAYTDSEKRRKALHQSKAPMCVLEIGRLVQKWIKAEEEDWKSLNFTSVLNAKAIFCLFRQPCALYSLHGGCSDKGKNSIWGLRKIN